MWVGARLDAARRRHRRRFRGRSTSDRKNRAACGVVLPKPTHFRRIRKRQGPRLVSLAASRPSDRRDLDLATAEGECVRLGRRVRHAPWASFTTPAATPCFLGYDGALFADVAPEVAGDRECADVVIVGVRRQR